MTLDQQLHEWRNKIAALTADLACARERNAWTPRVGYARQSLETAIAFIDLELKECQAVPTSKTSHS